MIEKKNPKVSLERKRPFFFLIGLSIAIFSAILVFQWETEFIEVASPEMEATVYTPEPSVIRTFRKEKQPKKVDKKVYAEIKDVFKVIDDLDQTLDLSSLSEPIDDSELMEGLEVIESPESNEKIEIIESVILEKLAIPTECGKLSTREEQFACLNNYVNSFMKRNVKYPKRALDIGLTDKVHLSFVISENGDVESVKVERGEYDVLNDAAVDALKTLPKFIPGRNNGRRVKMKMSVPVNFKY